MSYESSLASLVFTNSIILRRIEKNELKSIPGYDWANSQESILLKFARPKRFRDLRASPLQDAEISGPTIVPRRDRPDEGTLARSNATTRRPNIASFTSRSRSRVSLSLSLSHPSCPSRFALGWSGRMRV